MIKSKIFFTYRFIFTLCGLAMLYFTAFFIPDIIIIANILALILVFLLLIELVFLYLKKKPITAQRIVPVRISNAAETDIIIKSNNRLPIGVNITVAEELPTQLNLRDYTVKIAHKAKDKLQTTYTITPYTRGLYVFGNLNIYVRVLLGLVERKIKINRHDELKVYPSYLNLHQYDLKTLKTSQNMGIRKTRKLGNSLEFEQIKGYVLGDNIKHINWKATAKRNNFMVNQFTDEKSKEVYCIIDTGRSMKSPFNNLALVDYAINSSLIILKNALNFQDRAGMLSFNKKIENYVRAEAKPNYISTILEHLYAIQPAFLETDFSKLYAHLQRLISHRSLIFLFTNFEDDDAMQRQLQYFKAINKRHLLVVIFFKNVALENELQNPENKNLLQQTLIEKQLNSKKQIVSELNQHGIQTLLTAPDDLTLNLLNKYLEIKAKGLL